MKIGLFGINMNHLAQPKEAAIIAQHAEALGFESLWTGEHVVLPDPRQAPSPADPDTPMAHPPAFLAYLAALTTTIKLGTGITLVAQRNPVVLAKEIGTLDLITEGRLLFGVGAGYLHQEFEALGVDFESRGPRTDESIDAMRALWRDPKPSFQGKYYSVRWCPGPTAADPTRRPAPACRRGKPCRPAANRHKRPRLVRVCDGRRNCR